jgi:hypothetical protein
MRFFQLNLVTLALSICTAGGANAALVAGWDFSQYVSGGGFLSTDGSTLQNTLGANYASLDPDFNAGPESAAFGTLYLNGQFGSTDIVPVGNGTEAFLPIAGSLASNLTAAVPNNFDSFDILRAEGQPFQEALRMRAFAPLQVVFQATLGTVPEHGDDWVLSFGAQTLSGSASVNVEFSLDGAAWVSLSPVGLTDVDTRYEIALRNPGGGPISSDAMFVRLGFGDTGNATIDNVALSANLVPEPVAGLLLASGMTGLGLFGRRRRR